ncbi:MAG: amidohydrolase family protein [Chloroflexi bacterium]|nr:amidohydrolase family protein [Chloroflexota bacterium]
MPYQLRLIDFEMAMQDVYDLLLDINTALVSRDLPRLEEAVRPAIFSGIMSDALAASLARHSRVLTINRFHNGHPDLIPAGRYPNDAVQAGDEGVEVKATKGRGAVDTRGAREAWLSVFRYEVDSTTQPVINRAPTRIVEILLAKLTRDDYRKNCPGPLEIERLTIAHLHLTIPVVEGVRDGGIEMMLRRFADPAVRSRVSIEAAIQKMSGEPARRLGLSDRGVLRPGLIADVTIFNPATVVDRSEGSEMNQYPLGISYVVVNGQLTAAVGEHTGATAGVVLS